MSKYYRQGFAVPPYFFSYPNPGGLLVAHFVNSVERKIAYRSSGIIGNNRGQTTFSHFLCINSGLSPSTTIYKA
jgi:hypothetical protein